MPELDTPPAWWLQWHDRMATAVEEPERITAGDWPQGTRDLYANPWTAAYNRELSRALIAAMRI